MLVRDLSGPAFFTAHTYIQALLGNKVASIYVRSLLLCCSADQFTMNETPKGKPGREEENFLNPKVITVFSFEFYVGSQNKKPCFSIRQG